MASFDIITAASYGYRAAWQERRYLTRLAIAPLMIKFICLVVITALGWQDDFLRQGMVMLPSYLADGWMLSHFVRLIFLGQRWPFMISGEKEPDLALLKERARVIAAGTLVFTLTRFLFAGFAEAIAGLGIHYDTKPQDVAPQTAIGALAALVIGIWAFRFLWLYIPAAVSYSLRRSLRDLAGFNTSFYLIGTWLVCFVPVFTAFGFAISLILGPYVTDAAHIPSLIEFIMTLMRALMDTVVAFIATGGIAWGMRAIIAGRQGKV